MPELRRRREDVAVAAALVELKDVTKTYGPVRALLGVSCAFHAGQVAVVRGPNGSGKSTLLAILGALTRPTSGRVEYGELAAGPAGVRRNLGWLGHDSLCYPDLTGRENIELAANLHGIVAASAYAGALERFSLGGFAERAVRTYSRGQRQRIALARALVHQPLLLLLDEPTTGLDQAGTIRLIDVVRQEAERGAAVVVVTHDAAFESAVSGGGEIIALDRGRRV